MPLALLVLLALAGPTGLQVLHSPAAEQAQQEKLVERLQSPPTASERPRPRRLADPASPEERRAAAWRADHLTCASAAGRTPDHYQRECAAWAAEQAARKAGL